jgi:putative membrane protein
MKRILACAAVLTAFPWTASAADETKTDPSDKAASSAEFVTKATQGGLYEVKSSEFATQQGGSAEVKKFAEMMIADHTKANKELAAAAASKGLKVPEGVSPEQADLLKQLETLKGAEFDAEYVKQQVAAHEKAVALFKAQAKSGQDADLKAWAAKTLPTLEGHLKHVKELGSNHHNAPARGETPVR